MHEEDHLADVPSCMSLFRRVQCCSVASSAVPLCLLLDRCVCRGHFVSIAVSSCQSMLRPVD
jgi:hypothetical protein